MIRHRVVLIPFPFDDLSGTKVRPAVCLTEPLGRHRHVVLAFITSQVPEKLHLVQRDRFLARESMPALRKRVAPYPAQRAVSAIGATALLR